jgi:hypothetical protein
MEKEVSIIEIKEKTLIRYKVTKRIPEFYISETKIFKTKKEALKQFNEWLE